VEKTDLTEYTARMATILVEENVDFDLDTLDTYVKVAYPDLRKCINMLQQNVSEGKLLAPTAGEDGAADYKIEMVELFKSGNIEKARVLLCSQAKAEEMEDIYRFCYNNISLFGDNDEKQDNAVVIIKQGLVDHALCADAEINLAAVMIKLARNYHA
jgi:DNA polymerase III delta prime subunit